MPAFTLHRASSKPQDLKLQIWFEDDEGEGFGGGRVRLLMLIDELGSLSKAARQLVLAYVADVHQGVEKAVDRAFLQVQSLADFAGLGRAVQAEVFQHVKDFL